MFIYISSEDYEDALFGPPLDDIACSICGQINNTISGYHHSSKGPITYLKNRKNANADMRISLWRVAKVLS